MIRVSEAKKFPGITTVSKLGGIGLGRLINGIPHRSAGNGFYVECDGLEGYIIDDGGWYMQAVKTMSAARTLDHIRGDSKYIKL